MLQGHTTAIVPCGNPTPKKLPTGGGEWPTFPTAHAQRTVRPPSTQVCCSKASQSLYQQRCPPHSSCMEFHCYRKPAAEKWTALDSDA